MEVLDGLLLEMPVAEVNIADAAARRSTDRLAAMAVRRTALRHRCSGRECLDRNHRRDKNYARLLMTMLELPDDLATAADYQSSLDWGSMTREEGKLLY